MKNMLIETEPRPQLLLSEASQQVLFIAIKSPGDHVGTEHLLFGLLHDHDIQSLIETLGIDYEILLNLTQEYLSSDPNNPDTIDKFTQTTLNALISADFERAQRGGQVIEPSDIFLGMLSVEVGKGFLLLWEAKTGNEPLPDESDSKKAELLDNTRMILQSKGTQYLKP